VRPGWPIDFLSFFLVFLFSFIPFVEKLQPNNATFHFISFHMDGFLFQVTNGLAGEMIRPVCWANPLKLFSNLIRFAISVLSFCIQTTCIPRMYR